MPLSGNLFGIFSTGLRGCSEGGGVRGRRAICFGGASVSSVCAIFFGDASVSSMHGGAETSGRSGVPLGVHGILLRGDMGKLLLH